MLQLKRTWADNRCSDQGWSMIQLIIGGACICFRETCPIQQSAWQVMNTNPCCARTKLMQENKDKCTRCSAGSQFVPVSILSQKLRFISEVVFILTTGLKHGHWCCHCPSVSRPCPWHAVVPWVLGKLAFAKEFKRSQFRINLQIFDVKFRII